VVLPPSTFNDRFVKLIKGKWRIFLKINLASKTLWKRWIGIIRHVEPVNIMVASGGMNLYYDL
jgi:hypothetical protein